MVDLGGWKGNTCGGTVQYLLCETLFRGDAQQATVVQLGTGSPDLSSVLCCLRGQGRS